MATTQPINLKVGDLRNNYRDGLLILNPRYQRNAVWKVGQKKLLIDSMLRGFDLPKFYWRQITDENENIKYEVVDGQQRIRAVISFFENEFALDAESEKIGDEEIAGKKYNELSRGLQNLLNAYTISVMEITKASEDDISEMFQRLQNGTSLKASEKLHAERGILSDKIQELVLSSPFWRENTDITANRFDDFFNAAQLFRIELEGEAAAIGSGQISAMLEKYQRSDAPAVNWTSFQSKIGRLSRAFEGKSKLRKHQVISLYLLLTKLNGDYVYTVDGRFADWFFDIERRRIEIKNDENRDENDESVAGFIEYHADTLGGDNKSKLESRTRFLFERYLLEHPNTPAKDPERMFTKEERSVMVFKQRHLCADCKAPISVETSEADHVTRHADGGATSLSNGQALCLDCHAKKTKMENKKT